MLRTVSVRSFRQRACTAMPVQAIFFPRNASPMQAKVLVDEGASVQWSSGAGGSVWTWLPALLGAAHGVLQRERERGEDCHSP